MRDDFRYEISDRERILLKIIEGLAYSQSTAKDGPRWGRDYFTGHDGHVEVHFAPWEEPKKDDLVLARSGEVGRWKVGFYVEPLPNDYGGALIREIGTDVVCRYSNESFHPIRGLDEIDVPPAEVGLDPRYDVFVGDDVDDVVVYGRRAFLDPKIHIDPDPLGFAVLVGMNADRALEDHIADEHPAEGSLASGPLGGRRPFRVNPGQRAILFEIMARRL